MGKQKSSRFTPDGIKKLAGDKPAVYTIKDRGGKPKYIGSAKKGRVPERITEHLPGKRDPVKSGDSVSIRQYPSIKKTKAAEVRAIKRNKPPQNRRGK